MIERLSRVLAHVTGVGEYDSRHGKHASDAALWAIARAWDRDNSDGPELFERDVNDDLLDQLRDAYATGRHQLAAA